jgi:hypothetical protein
MLRPVRLKSHGISAFPATPLHVYIELFLPLYLENQSSSLDLKMTIFSVSQDPRVEGYLLMFMPEAIKFARLLVLAAPM